MNKKIWWGLGIIAVIYIILTVISDYYLDFEWFRIMGGQNIFWTLLLTKFNIQIAFFFIFIGMFFLNAVLMRFLGGKGRIFTNNILDRIKLPMAGSVRKAVYLIIIAAVVFIGILMAAGAGSYWNEYLSFTHSSPFSTFPVDPIFNKDIGFYIFSLPFYEFIYGWIMAGLVIITISSGIFHIANGGIVLYNGKVEFSLFSRAHLSSLTALIVFLFGLGYRISAYGLLFAQRGKFYGAGFSAVNAELVAYNICMIISIIGALLLIYNIFRKSFKLPLIVIAALIPAYIVFGSIYPALQQRFFVEPNELDLERPYIQNNIKFTRIAYGVDKVIQKNFANKSSLNYRDILKNSSTMNNIRIWDWRPLKQTYKQLQELKPYYQFYDVDVDRYIIDGNKTAVNLSARELSTDKLARNSQSWLNTHLIYTHGYGIALSRVDRATTEGLPEMLIYDIPPKNMLKAEIKEPRIYYGESNNPYAITNTNVTPGEFDYPSGDQNKFSYYEGTGGSKLDSFLKRVLFAISFKDINILISSNIKDESRILFHRNIMEMVNMFTPFLDFDKDPYLVLADGRLFWIIDGYTTSDRFPYSRPITTEKGDINYIRNSIKVIIDAYNGTMKYYISDENDPIIKTYSSIFPGIFKKMDDMPQSLKAHIRYPETIFSIQSNILLRYHMTDVNVFYNNEDVWDIPRHVFENTSEPIQNYYLVTTLPGESVSEFITIMPLTPVRKDNMIAFLVAKCDTPHYGEMTLYSLPKEKLSYGPMQIEARINQDPEISQLLTLWSQQGSGVIRGNMLAIPIEESLLFIEPLYLKAEQSEMPELKKIIVSFADRVIMDDTLKGAIEKLFQRGGFINESANPDKSNEAKLKDFAAKAYSYLQQAEEAQKNGNWAEYGEALKRLKEIIRAMKDSKK